MEVVPPISNKGDSKIYLCTDRDIHAVDRPKIV